MFVFVAVTISQETKTFTSLDIEFLVYSNSKVITFRNIGLYVTHKCINEEI